MSATEEELREFEAGRLDPGGFRHRDHVRLGYELLCRYSLGDAITRFSSGLRLLAAQAGRPQLYHETITVAFLALINERRVGGTAASWPDFEKIDIHFTFTGISSEQAGYYVGVWKENCPLYRAVAKSTLPKTRLDSAVKNVMAPSVSPWTTSGTTM